MRFFQAEYFYWLLTLPLLVAGGVASILRRRQAERRVADAHLLPSLAPESSLERQILKLVLVALAAGWMIVALARPQFGTHTEEVHRRGIDVIVALDTSKSMLARDVSSSQAGSRLSRAKMEVSGLIDRLQGDRIGLVAFAGAAFVQCPLTSDYAAAKLFLRAMEPGAIALGGTNLREALTAVAQMFDDSKGPSRSRVLVLISDGEDHAGGFEEALERLRGQGTVVHAVGVGTQIGELIPDAEGRYLRSEEGKAVMTRLQEGTLRALADATGGIYVHSAAGDLGFEAIYDELSRMQKADLESRVETIFEEKYQLFVLFAFLCLLAATLIPARRSANGAGHAGAAWR